MFETAKEMFSDQPDNVVGVYWCIALPLVNGKKKLSAHLAHFGCRIFLFPLPILMLTVHEDSDSVFSAVCAGACGYLLKETPPRPIARKHS
jgi:DNA-binding NarL/FixJ family response regulator